MDFDANSLRNFLFGISINKQKAFRRTAEGFLLIFGHAAAGTTKQKNSDKKDRTGNHNMERSVLKMEEPTRLSDRKTEKKAYIPGIECTVTNCLYNDDKRNCYAQKVQVSPMHAKDDDDTKCDTFKQKPSDDQILL